MTDVTPELQSFALVVLGSFNPAIFQPFWFSGMNLVRKEEAEAATIEIVHPKAAVFQTEWFNLQVIEQRFILETPDPTKSQPLRDLALGTFKILEHTPIRAFGFNRDLHIRMTSEQAWHAFGDFFAPKQAWTQILNNPGLRSLSMEGRLENLPETRTTVKLEPSTRLPPHGIFVHVNEHYGLTPDEPDHKAGNLKLLRSLQERWDGFHTYCDQVLNHLLTEYQRNE